MTRDEAAAFYGNQTRLAEALGIHQSAVCRWKTIPIPRQYQLQVMTKGKLKADPMPIKKKEKINEGS